jgi:DNA-binding MarR family transcriptional regulator
MQFLLQAKVWVVLNELSWGDLFERDLQEKMDEVEGSPESLEEIIDQLTEMGLVYQLKGERGSPYLSLTYKGQEVVGRLLETGDS